MALAYETSTLGISVRVFSDRVEYKAGFASPVQSIPINQITSIKLGSILSRIVIKTTGGREYAIVTGKKRETADAIYRAQAALRSAPGVAFVPPAVADELTKLARLLEQGLLSRPEFDRQKTVLLELPGRTVAVTPDDVTPRVTRARPETRRRSSIGRKIKLVALVIVGLFLVIGVIGTLVGQQYKKNTDSSVSNSVPDQAIGGFRDYKIEVTKNQKERPGDQDFRLMNVIFNELPTARMLWMR